jgi:hypothetical protein
MKSINLRIYPDMIPPLSKELIKFFFFNEKLYKI